MNERPRDRDPAELMFCLQRPALQAGLLPTTSRTLLADGREALVTARVEAEPGPLAALLEVAPLDDPA